MGILAIVALVLLVAIWLAGKFSKGDPRRLIELAKTYGLQAVGIVMLAFSAFAAMRGNWMPAVVLAPLGFGLLQANSAVRASLVGLGLGAGRQSRLSTVYFEVLIDQNSGAIAGRVVAGAFSGRDLATLDAASLLRLHAEVRGDPASLGLIETYLDRRLAGWREHVEQGARAGQGGTRPAQMMSKQEAYQILGLEPGASSEAIRAAHRLLMKRFHPDAGGSAWFAAKINAAKDALIERHG